MTTIYCRNKHITLNYLTDDALLNQIEGTIYIGNTQTTTLIQENGWMYLTETYSATGRKAYINGSQVMSSTSVNSMTSSADFRIGINNVLGGGKIAAIEFDTLKISPGELTQAQILSTTGMIFGNKFQWPSTNSYSFYNYGVNQNIVSIDDYDLGNTRVYNVVEKENSIETIYRTSFSWTPNSIVMVAYIREGNSITPITINSMESLVASLDKRNPNWSATLSGSVVTVDITNPDYDDMYKTSLYFTAYGTNPTFSIPENYAGFYQNAGVYYNFSAQFALYSDNSAYSIANTASIYDLGTKRIYKTSDSTTMTSEQFSIIANNMLPTLSTPKIRMKITTRFLEGDLDLFSRVTLNIQGDIRDGFLEWDKDGYDYGRAEKYVGESVAGNITWTSKDFWVIGINHNYNGGKSEYTLREV